MREKAGALSHADREALLEELQLCQEHLNTSYMRSWQSGAIILAGALATLALTLQIGAGALAAALITTVFAFGAVLVLGVWLLFMQRETAFQRVSIRRSRALEREIGMKRALLISALDDLIEEGAPAGRTHADLTDEDQHIVDEIYRVAYRWRVPYLTPGGASDTLYRIGFVVIVGWAVVVVWRWLIYAGVLD